MTMRDDLDIVWKALSDPTRRAILDLLRGGPRTTTEIAEAFPEMTRFGVMKHMEVLKGCRLVVTRPGGRKRIHRLNAAPIRRIYERWITPYEDFWAKQILDVKDHAEGRRKK